MNLVNFSIRSWAGLWLYSRIWLYFFKFNVGCVTRTRMMFCKTEMFHHRIGPERSVAKLLVVVCCLWSQTLPSTVYILQALRTRKLSASATIFFAGDKWDLLTSWDFFLPCTEAKEMRSDYFIVLQRMQNDQIYVQLSMNILFNSVIAN